MLFRSAIQPEFPSQPDAVTPDSVSSLRIALHEAVTRQCRRLGAHLLLAANGVHPANFFDVAVSHEIYLASRIHAAEGVDELAP